MVIAMGRQRGALGNFNGHRALALQDEKCSGDWLNNNVNIFNNTELYT